MSASKGVTREIEREREKREEEEEEEEEEDEGGGIMRELERPKAISFQDK